MSHTPYVGIFEYAASGKLRQLSKSSSSTTAPSSSQVISSIADDASDVTGVLRLNGVGKGKLAMFKTYRDL